jgi:hypothetical protein
MHEEDAVIKVALLEEGKEGRVGDKDAAWNLVLHVASE